jgi:hypothetical protein
MEEDRSDTFGSSYPISSLVMQRFKYLQELKVASAASALAEMDDEEYKVAIQQLEHRRRDQLPLPRLSTIVAMPPSLSVLSSSPAAVSSEDERLVHHHLTSLSLNMMDDMCINGWSLPSLRHLESRADDVSGAPSVVSLMFLTNFPSLHYLHLNSSFLKPHHLYHYRSQR